MTNYSNHSSYELDVGEFITSTVEFKARTILVKYVLPVFLFLGIVGNVFSCCIFKRDSRYKCALGFYFLTFSSLSLAFLVIKVFTEWIAVIFEIQHLKYLMDWICKLWQLVDALFDATPTWLMVAMAIDAFMIIYFPKKALYICTSLTAKAKVITILTALLFVNLHKTYIYKLNENDQANECTLWKKHSIFYTLIWPWLSAIINNYAPLLILAVFIIANCYGLLTLTTTGPPRNTEFHKGVIAVTISYFLLAIPLTIVNIIIYCISLDYIRQPHIAAKFQLASIVCQLVLWANHCITFVLYAACLPGFRKNFQDIILRKCIKNKQQIPSIEISMQELHNDDEKQEMLLNETAIQTMDTQPKAT